MSIGSFLSGAKSYIFRKTANAWYKSGDIVEAINDKAVAVSEHPIVSKSWKHTKNFSSNIILAGAAGAGLLALGAVLSSPKITPRRLEGPEEEPLGFAPGGSVELGGVAMPALGQQQGAGNWVAQLPSLEQQMAMSGGLPPAR